MIVKIISINYSRMYLVCQTGVLGLIIGLICHLSVAAEVKISLSDKEKEMMALTLTSESFVQNGMIPIRHTCDGQDASPELSWTGIPAGTKSLVLIVDDPDAPDPADPKMTWVHWVLYNVPPDIKGLPEGASVAGLQSGTLEGTNDWQRTGYGGPCPPIGIHRYFHKLYAVDKVLPDLKQPTKAALEEAMRGHVIEYFELIGLYRRSQ
jgi:Raf kinase inhibitor-like YbhB/YbcL family protein